MRTFRLYTVNLRQLLSHAISCPTAGGRTRSQRRASLRRRGPGVVEHVTKYVADEEDRPLPSGLSDSEMAAALSAELNRPGNSNDLDLPSDVNIEEAKMLEAAMLGVPYEGRLPSTEGRGGGPPPSAEAVERKQLRDEIDAAYEESLRLDR